MICCGIAFGWQQMRAALRKTLGAQERTGFASGWSGSEAAARERVPQAKMFSMYLSWRHLQQQPVTRGAALLANGVRGGPDLGI